MLAKQWSDSARRVIDCVEQALRGNRRRAANVPGHLAAKISLGEATAEYKCRIASV